MDGAKVYVVWWVHLTPDVRLHVVRVDNKAGSREAIKS